ncbi:MAG: hypothetical protein WCG37_08365, partial [Actinomycetes bacterium]
AIAAALPASAFLQVSTAGAAIPPASSGGFTGVSPFRLLDTRNFGSGPCLTGERSLAVAGVIGSDVPSDAAAVALNVTVINPSGSGFVTVWPAGVSRPTASSVNYSAGEVVPNNVIVAVGGFSAVTIFANAGCPHIVVDVVGWFASGSPAQGGLTGITPDRLLDTRSTGKGPCISTTRDLQVAGVPFTEVPADAAAVALNVTVITPNIPGYLTVFPTGSSRPTASTLNYSTNQVIANGTVVKVGASGSISLFASGGCPNVVVDVVGWFAPGTPTSAGGFFGVNPYRLLDSRNAGQVPCVGGSRTYHLNAAGVDGSAVPSESRAVALNVTVTGPAGAGFITVSPTGALRPTASNLNYVAGQTVPNGVLVKVGSSQSVDIFASGGCPDLIVDVVGGFAASPLDLVSGCTASDLLVAACSTFIQSSIAPPSKEIGAVDGASSVSADGRYVAFAAGTTTQIFRRDLLTGITTLVSHAPSGSLGNDSSYTPAISADGRYVAFTSDALNLQEVEKTSFNTELYRWDATTDTVLRLESGIGGSDANGDAWNPSISDDGNRIAFLSDTDNFLVSPPYLNYALIFDAFVIDVTSGTTIVASRTPLTISPPDGVISAVISGDGRFVAYETVDPLATYDTNGASDIYRRELSNNNWEWVTRRPLGGPSAAGATDPTISRDGGLIAFASTSAEFDLNASDTALTQDIFVRDMASDSITRSSVAPNGFVLNGDSYSPRISASGRMVAYLTDATNAVPSDTAGRTDLVVRDRTRGVNTRANVAPNLTESSAFIDSPVLSADGKYAGWNTASSYAPGDADNAQDSFLRFFASDISLSNISPASLTANSTPTLTLTGIGFADDALPVVDGQGVNISNVVINAEGTSLTFTLTISAVDSIGRHDIWVRNPGGASWSAAGAAAVGRTGLLRVG